jgi:tetratricopeptide (TPR) repeat protein
VYVEQQFPAPPDLAHLAQRLAAAYAHLVARLRTAIDETSWAAPLAAQCREDIEAILGLVPEGERAGLLYSWGWIVRRLGDQSRAAALAEQALELSQGSDPEQETLALNLLAILAQERGELSTALSYYDQAAALMRSERPSDAVMLLVNSSVILRDLGQYPEALERFSRARADAEASGLGCLVGLCEANIGRVLHDLGNLGEALAVYERALPIMRSDNVGPHLAMLLNNLGEPTLRRVGPRTPWPPARRPWPSHGRSRIAVRRPGSSIAWA